MRNVGYYLAKGLDRKTAEYFAAGRKRIVHVVPNDNFTLVISFDNGEKRLYDVAPLPKYFCSRVPMPPEIQQYWQHLSRLHQPHTKPMNIGPHQIHWICATCRQKRA